MSSLRPCVGCLVLPLLCVALLPAQESRWEQLDAQELQLVNQNKFAEALPIAAEALKIAEASLGPNDIHVSIALTHLADIYDDQKNFAEAEPLYQRALALREKALGPDHLDVAISLTNLADLYEEQSKHAQAEPLYQRALIIREKKLGPDHPDVAVSLNNLAVVFDNEDKYAQAEPLYQRSLSIDEKALGPDHLDVAQLLYNLARLYYHETKYAEAEPLYRRALQIREKALGPDNLVVALTLNNLALVLDSQGKYSEAEPLFQRALQIREKALGPDHLFVALSLNNLAVLDDHQGKYAEAEPLYQRALQIYEKALGPDNPDLARALSNLANVYDEEGKYAEAEGLIRRVLSIREKALGPEHRDVAISLNNLAALSMEQGKYAEAEPLYQRALRIWEKALGPDNPDLARALNNLALLYEREGKYAEEEPLLQRALVIWEKAFGPENSDVATALHNLAKLDVEENRYAEAEPLYERALRIWEKQLGPEHPRTALALNDLAMLYRHQGKYAEAEPLSQRALRIWEKEFGPDHPDLALALDNLARIYDEEGKYAEAEPFYRRALKIREAALGPDHPDVATSLNGLALVLDHEAKYTEAENLYQRDLDNLFQQFQYNFTYMTEKERLGFLDTVAHHFPNYFSFVHRFHGNEPQLAGSMYNVLLWEKGFVGNSVASLRRDIEASGDGEALKLVGQLAEKRTRIAALLNTNPKDRELWRKQVEQLKTEANDIEKALVIRSADFAERNRLERATWQQVRDVLRPGEAAVEFVHFRYYEKKWTGTSYYVALVVTHDTKDQPQYIFLGDDKQIEGGAVTHFQRELQTRGASAEPEAELLGANTWELVWKPLQRALAGNSRVYLSPDGILNELPLGIIPTPGGKLLMERYDLRLVSSTRDILRAAPPRTASTAILVGDPAFDLSEEQQLAAMRSLSFHGQEVPVLMADLSLGNGSRDLGNATTLPRLPGTGEEVKAIAELMRGRQWKTDVYTEDLALKRVVEQASGPRVVHLATHGFFLPDQKVETDRMGVGESQPSGLEDPMLRSGLYFAGANRTLAGKPSAEGIDNGVLTAMEAGSLNLRGTELVVLSACNTGQGDIENGEGVFGLRRAFEEAGAQAVLMSLWSVPDKETLELMKRFYGKWLSGMEIHQALKEAQLEMREQVRLNHHGRDLPYYWGAFVLVGR
jgi:tetratricopeptide (TPR) repeat protein